MIIEFFYCLLNSVDQQDLYNALCKACILIERLDLLYVSSLLSLFFILLFIILQLLLLFGKVFLSFINQTLRYSSFEKVLQ